MGIQSARMLGKSIVYEASVSPDTWEKHRLWGFSQPGYLQKAPSMGMQTAQMLGKSIVYEDSVSPDT